MTMKTSASMMLAGVLALGLGACDAGSTGSADGTATMTVAARGDDAPPSASTSPAEGSTYSQTSAQGSIRFRARVYAQAAAGGWTELTSEAAQRATVDASGRGDAVVLATSQVDAGSYTRVRVVFEEVTTDLSGSLTVSTGLLSGQVVVEMGSDGQVVVERAVRVGASAGATTRLVVNLNADAWLNSASAQTRTASEAAFAAAVRVSAQ